MAAGALQAKCTLDALLPSPDVEEIDDLHAVVVSQQEAEAMADGNESQVVDDRELGKAAVELVGKASLALDSHSVLPILVLHVKNLERFMMLEVDTLDEDRIPKQIRLSTRRTITTVEGTKVELPLVLGPGWQLVCLDLRDLLQRAFGAAYFSTSQIRIHGSCRIAAAFLSDRVYSDVELPDFLRVAGPEDPQKMRERSS